MRSGDGGDESEPAGKAEQRTASLLSPHSEIRNDAQSRLHRELDRLEERLSQHPKDYEARLLKGLLYFKSGRLDAALDELGELTRRAPKFQLAHLIQGDLLLAQTQTVSDIGGSPVISDLSDREQLEQLRQEAKVRLEGYLTSLQDRLLPRELLLLGPTVRTAVVVDKRTHRLFVYERGGDQSPKLIRDFYVSTGKLMGNKNIRGDLRTPEGVYFVTSYIPDQRLPDKYGVGAFPVNYPNELDRRMGRTGDGIWLHGTAREFYSRPPLDSEGCVVLTNVDLGVASDYLHPGMTPVVISDAVDWVDGDRLHTRRDEVMAAIEAWRADWESGDVDTYLDHYATDFWSGGYDLESWSDRKRRIARSKEYQRVDISDLSLFSYPDDAAEGREIVVANFHQAYDSNNYSGEMDKRLYLTLSKGGWKILYEGAQ